ncbi:MAG: hypothetical protein ACNYZH_08605, partial [Acidimicrobiia bacterium]
LILVDPSTPERTSGSQRGGTPTPVDVAELIAYADESLNVCLPHDRRDCGGDLSGLLNFDRGSLRLITMANSKLMSPLSMTAPCDEFPAGATAIHFWDEPTALGTRQPPAGTTMLLFSRMRVTRFESGHPYPIRCDPWTTSNVTHSTCSGN